MIFGHVKMQAEEKIRIDACRIFAPLLQRQIFVSRSCQVNGNAFVLFQLGFHRFGDDKRHFFFGIRSVFRTEVFTAMPRIDHYHNIFVPGITSRAL
jgi:hypothetical protein